jgi:condensin complex subunit 2
LVLSLESTVHTVLAKERISFLTFGVLTISCLFVCLFVCLLVCIRTANINISKLDAAYDIDPLFHKLSQKFDEGGAKGLLLVNLGVAHDGCRIILDSKEDSVVKDVEVEVNAENNDNIPTLQDDDDMEEMVNETKDTVEDTETLTESNICNEHSEEGMVDISGLSNKLRELMLCSPLDSTLLVPQLEEMRMAYEALEEEGLSADAKNLNPKVRLL